MTAPLPGIGPLHHQHGPDDLSMWTVLEPPRSALYGAPVDAHIMLEGTDDPAGADLEFVAAVLADVDAHIEAALRFAHARLLEDPAFFEWEDAGPHREFDAATFPLGDPQFNFYSDGWLLRFAEGGFPICEPYGLAVSFDRHTPIQVEGLADSEDPEDPGDA
ncbi:hypothetical protein ABZ816_06495 [Actinosynnema sp. NPDC047251]|uniref:DUF2262 domain-containing protein n=1 Tax=Saccharothrix espanaensis (strain ATCC 51144 / DSM 44229 / JCM 9112 / NBRC 15066 / NRRL 15764) TaxID=1179773 RepID=K0JQH1_SACES|nr:hypothetical protein [Saccharothrix espanaensis]CCH27896.1 hypothetical protein BN6_05650 [Saccharothrix espanaensis DSM 44229]